MTKKGKIILFSVVILLIILLIVFYLKNKSLKDEIDNNQFKPNSSASVSSTTSTTSNSTSSTASAPVAYIGSDYTKFKAGQRIRANKLVNVYNSPSATSGNIGKTFTAGLPIGYYQANTNGWLKVEYLYTNAVGWSYLQTGYILPSNQNVSTF